MKLKLDKQQGHIPQYTCLGDGQFDRGVNFLQAQLRSIFQYQIVKIFHSYRRSRFPNSFFLNDFLDLSPYSFLPRLQQFLLCPLVTSSQSFEQFPKLPGVQRIHSKKRMHCLALSSAQHPNTSAVKATIIKSIPLAYQLQIWKTVAFVSVFYGII